MGGQRDAVVLASGYEQGWVEDSGVNIVYCFVPHGDRESGFTGVSWIDMETMGSSVVFNDYYALPVRRLYTPSPPMLCLA